MSSQPNSVFAPLEKNALYGGAKDDPKIQQIKQSVEDAIAFQLWVSEQSHSLSRLKVFSTMAKSINDQQ